ncbi:MAG: glycosyltransferase [Prevotella sp.]|nr:glycosyltransferase [Prevotella sp.]
MKNKIKISVVTVTFRAEAVVKRTLDSVLAQTYDNVEHLIIDGASNDQTLTLAFDYKMRSDVAANGHEVVITSEPDHGLYDAMNKGLHKATGDYLVFLNAGDKLHSNDTLAIVAKMAEQKVLPAVIYGDTDVVDNDGKLLGKRHLRPPEELSWRSFRQGMLVCHQAFYALTSIAREQEYDLKYRYSADVDWCIRVMKQGETEQRPMANTHQVLVDYLKEGQTTLHHRDSLKERFRVMCHHYGTISTILMHVWFAIRNAIRPS